MRRVFPRLLASVLERRQRVPPAAEENQPQPVSHDSGDVKSREHVQLVAENPRGSSSLKSFSTEHSGAGRDNTYRGSRVPEACQPVHGI